MKFVTAGGRWRLLAVETRNGRIQGSDLLRRASRRGEWNVYLFGEGFRGEELLPDMDIFLGADTLTVFEAPLLERDMGLLAALLTVDGSGGDGCGQPMDLGRSGPLLLRHQIEVEIDSGQLRFSPAIMATQLGTSSVDLRLDYAFDTDVDGIFETVLTPGESLRVDPGQFLIGRTVERLTMPRGLAGILFTRSTWAKNGIDACGTSQWVHPLSDEQLKLEISNRGGKPVDLRPGTPAGALVHLALLRTAGAGESSDGRRQP